MPVKPPDSFVKYVKAEIEQSISDRFEKIVARYPERLAVQGRSGSLTYDGLNRAANKLAHAILRERGRVGEPVGLLLGQQPAITAILALLKAAKFYTPLAPSHPPERLSSILQFCQIKVLITDSKHFRLAKDLAGNECNLICIDGLDPRLSTENLHLTVPPDAIAAVVHTSGSTGRPKGVIQNHLTVLHRVMIGANSSCICPEDRVSFIISPDYSASIRNLFVALLNGAAVYPFNLVEEGVTQLSDWLSREKLTIYTSVATKKCSWCRF